VIGPILLALFSSLPGLTHGCPVAYSGPLRFGTPVYFAFVMPVLVTGIHDFRHASERRGWPAFAGHDAQEMLILPRF
jgi:hypothetical protein